MSETRTLGTNGPVVSRLCLGTSSWTRERFGAGPVEALEWTLASGVINFVDTSNEYGGEYSERLIGDSIRRHGAVSGGTGLPAGTVVQTKLDRDPETGSFSGDRMWRSLLESTAKLGLDRLPMLYLHDPERISWDEAFAAGGPVRALVEMKERGLVEQIGISGGPAPMLQRYVETGLFSAVITHNRYTLVDRSSEELLNVSAQRGVSVVNAAVYGGGALAKWPSPAATYAYRPAAPEMADAIARMGAACQRAGVSLTAAALQFSTRDPRIVSTIVGGNSVAQVLEAVTADEEQIPAGLWDELDELVPSSALWQESPGSTWP
jgi:D-threo-aldose 1-dehydrogenase